MYEPLPKEEINDLDNEPKPGDDILNEIKLNAKKMIQERDEAYEQELKNLYSELRDEIEHNDTKIKEYMSTNILNSTDNSYYRDGQILYFKYGWKYESENPLHYYYRDNPLEKNISVNLKSREDAEKVFETQSFGDTSLVDLLKQKFPAPFRIVIHDKAYHEYRIHISWNPPAKPSSNDPLNKLCSECTIL